MTELTRREVLVLSGQAAVLYAAGGIPMLAADEPIRAGVVDGIAAPLAPMRGPLQRYTPVSAAGTPSRLTWSMQLWNKRTGTTTQCFRMGAMQVERRQEGGDIIYSTELRHKLERCTRTGHFICHGKSPASVREGSTTLVADAHPDLPHRAAARVKAGRLQVGARSVAVPKDEILVAAWSMPFLLQHGVVAEETTLCVMDEDLTLRPHQRLRKRDQLDVPVAGGSVPMQAWSLHGPGTLPTYYLLDDNQLPQFILTGFLGWMLSEAEGVQSDV